MSPARGTEQLRDLTSTGTRAPGCCAFPLDRGARPLCRRLRGRGCANCQSLPQAELFVRPRERPGLHSPAVAWPPRRSAGRRESGSQRPWLRDEALFHCAHFSLSCIGEGNGNPLQCSCLEGTLKSLLQHHSWKASIPGHSAFFLVQLSQPYMITGKNQIGRAHV